MRSTLLLLVDKLENAEIQKVERTHNIIKGETTITMEILTNNVGEAFKQVEKELSANSVFTIVVTEMLTQRVEH